jgi:hypothetical protein
VARDSGTSPLGVRVSRTVLCLEDHSRTDLSRADSRTDSRTDMVRTGVYKFAGDDRRESCSVLNFTYHKLPGSPHSTSYHAMRKRQR